MDLFDFKTGENAKNNAPLADRMRPRNLQEFIGQKHIVATNSLLWRAITVDKMVSCIFYGPPGTGKTTLASIIASQTKGNFVKLNAVSSGVADAKAAIEQAKNNLKMYGKKTYLLLDECHRWSKAQSDCVLGAIEDGSIIFIGSTTENPFVSMTRAIVSRCKIFELKPLDGQDIIVALRSATSDKQRGLGNYNLEVEPDAYRHFAWSANGDLRNALNSLELAVLSTPPDKNGKIYVSKETAEQSCQKKTLSIDDSQYYDMLSAFCKSLRGSDPDAALFWAFRLTESGIDPLIIFRRLIAHASEDVGMADSNALQVVTSALTAYKEVGYAEGSLAMTHAIIYVSTAPKSNRVVSARANAIEAVNLSGATDVPHYLRDRNYASVLDDKSEYKYPHDFGGYCAQRYLPESVGKAKFYYPTKEGDEKRVWDFLHNLPKESDKL